MSLHIISYADEKYEIFILPYIYFALKTNTDCTIEIFLDDLDGFYKRYSSSVDYFRKKFGDNFYLTQSKFEKSSVIPNTIRFLEAPSVESTYIYIGDIDLLILADVADVHVKLIETYKIPFSNIVRLSSIDTDQPRLTGLHFCKFTDYYPLPDISDLDLKKLNDEHVLFEIMNRKGKKLPQTFQMRPDCGIHMSLNRDPFGRYSGINAKKFDTNVNLKWSGSAYFNKYIEVVKSECYANSLRHFSFEFRALSLILEALIDEKNDVLHQIASSFMIDRRTISCRDIEKSSIIKERDSYIKSKDMLSAMELSSKLIQFWPLDVDCWFKYTWNAKAIKDSERYELGLRNLKRLDPSIIEKSSIGNWP